MKHCIAPSDLDVGDRSALEALLEIAIDLTGAANAWWETADSADVLFGGASASHAESDIRHFDAVLEGQCIARLTLLAPLYLPADLTRVLVPAAALLRARASAVAARLESERLRDAVRAATDWLWETDADSRVVWMTESIATVTGIDANAEVGTVTMEINRARTDEYAASYEKYVADRAARRPIRDVVLDRDTPNGTITVSISGEPRFGPDGQFLGYRGATRNITEEVKAREDARRAMALLQHALEGLPAGVMITGPDDRILLANRRWRESVGADLHGQCDTWTEVVRHQVALGNYPDARGREVEYIDWRLSLASASPTPVELRWQDRWALVADQRLPDGNVVHLSMDITDRKRTELALAVAEDRWRFALDGAAHGVWDWERGQGTYFSPSWKAMVGLGEGDNRLSARSWHSRLHPEDVHRVLREVRRHVHGETQAYEVDYRLLHRNGNYVWIHDRGRAIRRDRKGWPMRMVGTQSDITRLRQADEALRDKQVAEIASRRMSEFLSRMSHEIRTPLNAVIGFTELLQARGEYRRDYVEHVLAAGRHLLELINDVLDLQQVEQGKVSLRMRALPAYDVVSAADAMLGPSAEASGIERRIEGFAGVVVNADEQRLRQVLLNLGSNAIKYNRPGGHLRWAVDDSDPTRWGLVVEDTGRGLDQAHLARLFQPFERLGHETSAIPGSGLGLIIARRLVEAMDGELAMSSLPGLGTRVTVWLPRADPAAQLETTATTILETQPTAAAPDSPRRILYVEDDAVNALLFAEALRGHDRFSPRVAQNGIQALQIAREWHPDLLVIDMNLPGTDGARVLLQLREIPGLAFVPAVVCSADALPVDQQRALESGFVEYWTKPLDVRELPKKIDFALGAHQLARSAAESDRP